MFFKLFQFATEYIKKNFLYVAFQIKESQEEAERDGVTVPMTSEEYCIQRKVILWLINYEKSKRRSRWKYRLLKKVLEWKQVKIFQASRTSDELDFEMYDDLDDEDSNEEADYSIDSSQHPSAESLISNPSQVSI